MIADTTHRVEHLDDAAVTARNEQRTEASVAFYAEHPDRIHRRLADLDREWDVERVLETMAPAVTLAGLLLTVFKNRRFIVLPMVVQGFFLQHAIQGWCPPLPVLRRLGVRTMAEINRERYALKALRGDFAGIKPTDGRPVTRAYAAARASD